MSPQLEHAIREARRIRNNLMRSDGGWTNLSGRCGLASLLLADALGGPRSLRIVYRSDVMHVWNVVDSVIIDITATQFNEPEGAGGQEPRVHGVLVTKKPRDYHRPVAAWSRLVVQTVVEEMLDPEDTLWQRVTRRGVVERLIEPRRKRITA